MSASKTLAPSGTRAPVTAGPPTTLSIGDAARLLSVSIKTIRRWEADGRIVPVRTEGGHRRFPLAALTQLHDKRRDQTASALQLRTAAMPSRPLPALTRLLCARLDAVVNRTTRHIYGEHRPGWFRSAGASPHVTAFAGQLAAGAETGDWQLVKAATAMLIIRAAGAEDGPTYQETFMFLRVLRAVLIQELRVQDESAPLELTKLFDAIEDEAAHNAGRFFESTPAHPIDLRAVPQADQGAPRISPRARMAAQSACERLAEMDSCRGVLVLAGREGAERLNVVCSAELEVGASPGYTLSEDPLSAGLRGQGATFVRSTMATRRLPLASVPDRCLPLVACTGASPELRWATIILVRAGADVDSGVLAPLAELNRRLASVAVGAESEGEAEAEIELCLQRLGPHLGRRGRSQSVSIRARAS